MARSKSSDSAPNSSQPKSDEKTATASGLAPGHVRHSASDNDEGSKEPSSLHDLIRSWAAIITCIAATSGVVTAWIQIAKVNEAREDARQREIRGATSHAIELYQLDSLLVEARNRVGRASKSGKDYTGLADNEEVVRDVAMNLNMLELIAVGIRQGIYNEAMVRDYFEDYLNKYVPVFIQGSTGAKPFFRPEEFPRIVELHKRWSEAGPPKYEAHK